MVDLAAYLDRVRYSGPVRPDFETLRALHRAHMLAIPYESFDVALKRPLTTDPEAAFDKIVNRKRGGWCYEMNGTFGLALKAAGFDVTRLTGDGADRASHLVLRVMIDGKPFVVDVGFADGPMEPYALTPGPFEQGGYAFAVEELSADRWRLINHKLGTVHGFEAGPGDEAAMAATCQVLQTSETSPFTQATIAFSRLPDGTVISLIGRIFRIVHPDRVERTLMDSADHYVTTLRDRFHLDLPEAATLWPVICERHEAYERARAAAKAAAS